MSPSPGAAGRDSGSAPRVPAWPPQAVGVTALRDGHTGTLPKAAREATAHLRNRCPPYWGAWRGGSACLPPSLGGSQGSCLPTTPGAFIPRRHARRSPIQRLFAAACGCDWGGGGTTTDPVGMATGWLGGGVHVTWGSPPAPVAPVLPPLPSHLPAGLQAGRPWGDRRHFGPRVGSWGHPCPPTHQSPRCRGPCPGAVGPQPGFSCPASSSSRREAGPTRDLPAAGGAHGEEDGHRCVPPTPLPTPLTLSPTEAASKGLGGGDTQRSPPLQLLQQAPTGAQGWPCTGIPLHGGGLVRTVYVSTESPQPSIAGSVPQFPHWLVTVPGRAIVRLGSSGDPHL